MLLEIPLIAGNQDEKTLAAADVTGRTYYETKAFVCDKAWVPKVSVRKVPGKRGALALEVTPTVKTGWYRQSVTLSASLVDTTGKEHQRTEEGLTIGDDDSFANRAGIGVAGASTSKMPTYRFRFKAGEFERLFEGGIAKLRIVLAVEE